LIWRGESSYGISLFSGKLATPGKLALFDSKGGYGMIK